MKSGRGAGRPRRRRLGLGVATVLIGAAVATELGKPAAERTWHGRIAGTVPYDLRRPTLERVQQRWWSPADSHILVPTVFGVGWTVNLGGLVRRIRGAAAPG